MFDLMSIDSGLQQKNYLCGGRLYSVDHPSVSKSHQLRVTIFQYLSVLSLLKSGIFYL